MTYIQNPDQIKKDEILIRIQNEVHQPPVKLNSNNSGDPDRLKSFVTDFFSNAGVEIDKGQWKSSNEVILNDCSNLTLHSLALRAEELGKKITYSRSLTIKISE
jgi:hypothetical protein